MPDIEQRVKELEEQVRTLETALNKLKTSFGRHRHYKGDTYMLYTSPPNPGYSESSGTFGPG